MKEIALLQKKKSHIPYIFFFHYFNNLTRARCNIEFLFFKMGSQIDDLINFRAQLSYRGLYKPSVTHIKKERALHLSI